MGRRWLVCLVLRRGVVLVLVLGLGMWRWLMRVKSRMELELVLEKGRAGKLVVGRGKRKGERGGDDSFLVSVDGNGQCRRLGSTDQ